MTKFQEKLTFYFILFLAIFIRLYKLNTIPLGLDLDEALNGYEALSLLTTGHDSWEYKFPLYFLFWGKGATVLHAYLTLPLIPLFGLNTLSVRLPHALLSILSCYIFYRLLRLIFSRPIALLGFFLSSIVPWQILLTRRGLEINSAPFFILAGFYFFARSHKNKDYLLLSALFYGLSLHTYGVVWIYTALTFGLELLYFLSHKRDNSALLTVLTAGMIFTVFAFPIILITLINNNFIPEIKTDYFSIPKLTEWRGSEINFQDSISRLKNTLILILSGNENSTDAIIPYGVFYPISIPFIFIGIYFLYKMSKENLKKQQFSISLCILINLAIGFFYSLTFIACIHRLNFLWFFFLICIISGLSPLITKQHLGKLIVSVYLIFFIFFYHTFLTQYNSMVADWFQPDLKPTLEAAENAHQKTSLPIKILESYWLHSKVLFYTQTPPIEYTTTVKRQKNFLNPVASFTHFYFSPDIDYNNPPTDAIYIAPSERLPFFHNFNTRVIGTYLVAVPK